MTLNVALTALLSFVLLVLSVIELRKPSPVAKMTGLAWVLFAVAIGGVSTSLLITGMTWQLLNVKEPWASIISLGSMAISSFVLGIVTLMRVVVARDKETVEREAQVRSNAEPQEGVWPPPPRTP